MNYKIMMSLMIMLCIGNFVYCSDEQEMQTIRVDSIDAHGEVGVNFLVNLSAEHNDGKKYLADFKKWQEKRINAYKKEYCVPDSAHTFDEAFIANYVRKNGPLDFEHRFDNKSGVRMIPMHSLGRRLIQFTASCHYEGYPEWKFIGLIGYNDNEIEQQVQEIRDQRS